MAEDMGRELGWDEEISNENTEFVVLPEGEYEYQVLSFQRGRHPGSTNLPPCAKAVLKLKIEAPQGVTIIEHNLFLNTKTQGFLAEFFISIGQAKKDDEKIRMNWSAVPGARGRAKVYIDTWEYQGEEYQGNKIKKFLPPNEGTSPQAASYTSGRF